MQLVKTKGHYYKYQSYRENGKSGKKYLGKANCWDMFVYNIRKIFNKN